METESPVQTGNGLGSSILATRSADVPKVTSNPDRMPQSHVDIDQYDDDEEALVATLATSAIPPPPQKTNADIQEPLPKKRKPDDVPLNDGVMAALSKLRKSG